MSDDDPRESRSLAAEWRPLDEIIGSIHAALEKSNQRLSSNPTHPVRIADCEMTLSVLLRLDPDTDEAKVILSGNLRDDPRTLARQSDERAEGSGFGEGEERDIDPRYLTQIRLTLKPTIPALRT
jgi:hypothetical protein